MNPCVVIQGRGDHLNTIIHNYNPDNTIISTWKDVSPVEGYTSIHNDLLPRIHGNLNLQAFSTHQGCLKAKDMGYDYVLKVRSDISIKDIDKLFHCLDDDKFCFYSYVSDPSPYKYLTDYIVGGPIDEMIRLWDVKKVNTQICAEEQLTLRLINLIKPNEIQFLLSIFHDNDIACYWHKLGYDLRKNYPDPQYNTNHNPYHSYPLQGKVLEY